MNVQMNADCLAQHSHIVHSITSVAFNTQMLIVELDIECSEKRSLSSTTLAQSPFNYFSSV